MNEIIAWIVSQTGGESVVEKYTGVGVTVGILIAVGTTLLRVLNRGRELDDQGNQLLKLLQKQLADERSQCQAQLDSQDKRIKYLEGILLKGNADD